MPTDSKGISQDVKRSSGDKGLGYSRANWYYYLLSPFENFARCVLFGSVCRGVTEFILHRFEDQLPLLSELPFIISQITYDKQVVTKPSRTLLKGAVEVTDRGQDPLLASLREL